MLGGIRMGLLTPHLLLHPQYTVTGDGYTMVFVFEVVFVSHSVCVKRELDVSFSS